MGEVDYSSQRRGRDRDHPVNHLRCQGRQAAVQVPIEWLEYFSTDMDRGVFWCQARVRRPKVDDLGGKIEGRIVDGGQYVLDLIVTNPKYRGKGIARALLERLFDKAGGRDNVMAQDFSREGAALWKAVTGETVPVTQRIDYGGFDWDYA